MITRLTLLKGIGRFLDCPSLGGRHFNKNTIIFGPNAGGKSTLTDIFWSFKTGNSSVIEGRKTFGFNGTPEVEFFDDKDNKYKYPSSEWLSGSEVIEIFDTQFINQNIFEGSVITYGHQKNLHGIIIGQKGNKLTNEINNLQNQIGEYTSRKTTKTNEFNRSFKKEISVEDFSKLPKLDNVEKKITECKELIETYNNQAKIKAAFAQVDLQLKSVLMQSTKETLSKSMRIDTDQIIDHLKKSWSNPNHSKDFLQIGLSLTKDDLKYCVFCGQELSPHAKDLLNEYGKLFSQEYKKLQAKVAEDVTKFLKWNPSTYIDSIKDKLASAKIELILENIDKSRLGSLKELIDNEFEKKNKDLDFNVNFENFDSLIEIFQTIQIQIDKLKKQHILDSQTSIDQLNRNLKQTEFSKLRHSKEWDDFIKEYDDIDNAQNKLKIKREQIRAELDIYSNQVFKIHLDTINKILEQLGTDFTICDFQPIRKLVGQTERIFVLKFFKRHNVRIDETSSDKPNFKNTLSESDKRVLAFAFFYSLMIHDDKLREKIIVFDDPFSSFDSDRRTKTAELLANPHLIDENGAIVEKEINQLIILTHESEFFKWIFRRLDNPKALRIIPNGQNNGVSKSMIVDCDVAQEFIEDENLKNLRDIHELLIANKPINDYEGICAKCRVILENIFKRKYLFELEDEINLNRSVRTFITKLNELKINQFDNGAKYKKFMFLCDNLNIELHDTNMKNDCKNAVTVLNDFFTLIKEI